MRRRRLLAALGTGTVAGLAGCGYLHGGGDVRRDVEIGRRGVNPDGPTRYAVDGGRVATVSNGRHVLWGDGGAQFVDGASVSVVDGHGGLRWDAFHPATSVAVALDDAVYLLDEEGRVAAFGPAEGEGADGGGPGNPDTADGDPAPSDPADGTERWRSRVATRADTVPEDEPWALVAGDGGAYVAAADELVRLADGNRRWSRRLPGRIDGLATAGEGVVATDEDGVVAFGPDGSERWRRPEHPAGTRLAVAGGRAFLREPDDRLVAVDPTDGDRLWRASVAGDGDLVATADAVALFADGSLSVRDPTDGTERWRSARSFGLTMPVVPAPEGAYGVRGPGCEVVALDTDGSVRWRAAPPDTDACGAVGGWLDGPTVVFVLDVGRLVGFQRTDEQPPLYP